LSDERAAGELIAAYAGRRLPAGTPQTLEDKVCGPPVVMIFSSLCGAFCHKRHFYFRKGEKNARRFSGAKYLLTGFWNRDLAGAAAGHGRTNTGAVGAAARRRTYA